MNVIAALLALPVGALFIWSGIAKAAAEPARLGRLALADLLGQKRIAAIILRVVGVLELCIGSAILVNPGWPWPRWAAVGVAAGGAVYATVALRFAPGTGCGCFGMASSRAISPGTVVRGLSLAAAAGATVTTSTSWTGAFSASPGLALVVVTVETACFAGLFREELASLSWRRDDRGEVAHTDIEDCATALVPPEVTMQRLVASEVWAALRPHLTDERPVDQWREGCWRFVCFPAAHGNREATAVFAVRLPPDAARCTGAIVTDDSDELAARVESRGNATAHTGAPLEPTPGGVGVLAGATEGGGQ